MPRPEGQPERDERQKPDAEREGTVPANQTFCTTTATPAPSTPAGHGGRMDPPFETVIHSDTPSFQERPSGVRRQARYLYALQINGCDNLYSGPRAREHQFFAEERRRQKDKLFVENMGFSERHSGGGGSGQRARGSGPRAGISSASGSWSW